MKTYIILIGIFFALFLVFIILKENIKYAISIDTCLDTGFCDQGLELNEHDKKFTITKDTCISHNGVWIENKNVCFFKD